MSDVHSIIEQAYPWRAGFFDFGRAKQPDVTYFNCCIHPRADADWLITRRAHWKPGQRMGHNSLMAFRLNGDLVPQVGYKIRMAGSESEHFEDPRCVVHGGRLWVSACNFIVFNIPGNQRWTGAHQVLCRVSDDWQTSDRFDPVYGKNGPSLHANIGEIHEKNWLWFSHDGALHMIYAAVPHEVVRWNDDITAGTVWKTPVVYCPWTKGEIRGGTTPVLVGKEYWTFFHSSLPWLHKKRQYHMGAYAFEAHPPFRITRMTNRPLLTGSPNDHWLPGKPACIFPCGSVYRNEKWLIVGGSNDLDCFWAEIPHEDLLSRTVSTLEKPTPKTWLTKGAQLLTSPA